MPAAFTLKGSDVARLKVALAHTQSFRVDGLDISGTPGTPGAPGGPGPPGPVGPAGLATIPFVAGEAIGSPRAVMLVSGLLFLFDPSVEAYAQRVIGVSQNSAIAGDVVQVVQTGSLSSAGSFIADSVYYAGAAGVLTLTPPSVGISVKIGVSVDTDTIIVDASDPVVLA